MLFQSNNRGLARRIFVGALLGFSLSAMAQTRNASENPTPEYRGVGNGSHLIGISKLYGDPGICGADHSPFVGTIVKKTFDSDEMTIRGFVLRLTNDERVFVNLTWDNLNSWNERQSKAGQINILELLKLGGQVRVTTFTCGSGSIVFADSIRKVP